MLTSGARTQAELIAKIGSPSNARLLAQELGDGWTSTFFGSGEDALQAAQRGPMGATLMAPGARMGHMVVTSPIGNGRFLVMDPWDGGSAYEVGNQWIEQYVQSGAFQTGL
jgi:hypothetical protein